MRILLAILAVACLPFSAFGATHHRAKSRVAPSKRAVSSGRLAGAKRSRGSRLVLASAHHPVSHLARLRSSRKRVIWNPWTEPTFADSTSADSVDGEDLMVRRAAVQALGPYNGTIVVSDPRTGRILSIVNQGLAFKSGFQPCSTIKLVAALGGLNEGVVERNTLLHIGRRTNMDLTEALAR